jgi:hypothetical protein
MTLLRTLLALVVVVIGPGYLLVLALYPRAGPRDGERIALAIGCSLAVTVIVGLLLGLSGAGFSGTNLNWSLGATSAVVAVLALVRAPRGGSRRPSRSTILRSARRASAIALPWLVLSALGVVALAIARHSAKSVARRSGFAQFWLVPDGTGAKLGVASFEQHQMRFSIVVNDGHTPIASSKITLAPSATYTMEVAVPSSPRHRERITASLFMAGSPSPYRTVSWSPPTAAGG